MNDKFLLSHKVLSDKMRDYYIQDVFYAAAEWMQKSGVPSIFKK